MVYSTQHYNNMMASRNDDYDVIHCTSTDTGDYPSDAFTTTTSASSSAASQSFSIASAEDDNDDERLPELEWSDIRVGRLLGKGAFSKVKEASFRRSSGNKKRCNERRRQQQKYAIKYLRNSTITSRLFTSAAVDLSVEGKLLQNLSHENIVTLHAQGCLTRAYDKGCRHFLLLDRLDTTLDEMIHEWASPDMPLFMEPQFDSWRTVPSQLERIHNIAIPIAKAMEYLHAHSICFRDIKPSNIGSQNGIAKLFDFGLARQISHGRKLNDMVGSLLYMAPEVHREDFYGLAVDVYSYSIVLWELLTLQIPFEGMSRKELEAAVLRDNERPPLDKSVGSTQLQELISRGWNESPELRPTFSEIREALENEVMALGKVAVSREEDGGESELDTKQLTTRARAA